MDVFLQKFLIYMTEFASSLYIVILLLFLNLDNKIFVLILSTTSFTSGTSKDVPDVPSPTSLTLTYFHRRLLDSLK